jgi:hypothetical protein
MVMSPIRLTRRQARAFLLKKQGLRNCSRYAGKTGALRFIRLAGCIQFDPLDICGQNAELVLQSRIDGFRKEWLAELLYQDRELLDYFDKNLSIIPMDNWSRYEDVRQHYRQIPRLRDLVSTHEASVHNVLINQDYINANDLDFGLPEIGYWGRSTSRARMVLEAMYHMGYLVIHHKKGAKKFYTLPERVMPADFCRPQQKGYEAEAQLCWHVRQRIRSVGLLWNRPSDAWLGVMGLTGPERNRVFGKLYDQGEIRDAQVDGIHHTLYYDNSDYQLLEEVIVSCDESARSEFIAPLDNMIWDRKLIEALFDFRYRWEVYTPPEKREFGHYVLPWLFNDRFIGRVELNYRRKHDSLIVKGVWLEPGYTMEGKIKDALENTLARFVEFCRSG